LILTFFHILRLFFIHSVVNIEKYFYSENTNIRINLNNIWLAANRFLVLLMEETRVLREKHRPTHVSQVIDKLYRIMLYWVHLTMNGVQIHNFSGDGHWFHRLISPVFDGPITRRV
jgi:hypothetical protein